MFVLIYYILPISCLHDNHHSLRCKGMKKTTTPCNLSVKINEY